MVTNQRGVAKGLTKIEDVQKIHANMQEEIEAAGGRIDKIYVCTDMNGPNRKPDTGMGLQALADFSQIDLKKSIMAGNTLSDMEFGRNLGVAINVLIGSRVALTDQRSLPADISFPDLESFSKSL